MTAERIKALEDEVHRLAQENANRGTRIVALEQENALLRDAVRKAARVERPGEYTR